jgi:hypothetical protein
MYLCFPPKTPIAGYRGKLRIQYQQTPPRTSALPEDLLFLDICDIFPYIRELEDRFYVRYHEWFDVTLASSPQMSVAFDHSGNVSTALTPFLFLTE